MHDRDQLHRSAFTRPFTPQLAQAVDLDGLLELHRSTFGGATMATIATTPFVLVDAIMTVGADDYQTAVSSVQFTPAVSQVTWQGLTPAAAFVGTTSPLWSCKVKYAQDWKTANSLAQYLLANAGTTKVVVFKPQGVTTGSPIFTASLIIVPGPIGGDVNTVQVGEVTMGVVGTPVKTAAP